ncbi:MAG: hypothetical protein BMS9Abin37_1914 [Acidobacteriota bacterium]|nr:MAG: hypothetical protein BMS9Abin37_1914 [Acidobacteriota bacterium]
MRFLVITPSISGKDGVSCLSRHLALALAELENDDDVAVWSLAGKNDSVTELAHAGISVRGARDGKARLVTWLVSCLATDCSDLTVVVMHAHLAPLSLPLHGRGVRVLQVLLGIEVWKPLTRLQARAFRMAERLVCISAHSERLFNDVNPGFDHTIVCHPGLPDRPRCGECDDEGFALMVGRMASSERYKGHDVLLDVWPKILDEAPHAKLVIVGGGDDRSRLIAKAKALGVSDAVGFTGTLPVEELGRLYRCSSFFVMPSVHEGFGLVFLEAMRAAKACIGGVGAASEIIEHGTTGYIVDPSDHAALSRSIVELFVDPARRAAMGQRGRERFECHFTSAYFRERLREALSVAGD